MLAALRQATGGIVAKILLSLLVISFAVWGASGAFVGGASSEAIRVGSTRVSALDYRLAYQTRVSALEQQLNQRLTLEQARIFGIQQSVTDQLIAGAVLDENAAGMGLGISDEQLAKVIGNDPAFKDSFGNFSRERLVSVLRSIGMSEDSFVQNQKSVAMRQQLVSGLAQGLSAPDAFFSAFAQYQSEKRVLDHALVDASAVPAVAKPTETDLTAWYEENKANFVAPEYRKLLLVRLVAQDIAKPEALSADEVAAEYEKTKAQFTDPQQRRIRQIAFADAAAAKAAGDRLAGGVPLETILTELGRTLADTELGMLRKDQIPDKIVGDAAFALELNKPSAVVEGLFGPVILLVQEIKPESVKALAQIEPQIRKSLAEAKANDELFATHDKLEDERAAGDPLADAAAKAGLKPIVIEQVDASGNGPDGKPVEGIPEAKAVLAEAFQTDEGVEADPVNIGTAGFVWFEVSAITPERQKPLTEVRDAVVAGWTQAKIASEIDAIAEAIRQRVAKGEDFAAVLAASLPPVNGVAPVPHASAELLRTDTSAQLPLAAVQAGFAQAQGAVLTAAGPTPPAKLVVRIAKIIPGADASPPPELVKQMDSQLSDDLVADLVGQLQSGQEVIVNPAAIDAALSF